MKSLAYFVQPDLIEAMRSGGAERERAVNYIFNHSKLRAGVYQYILKQGGRTNDAEEILTEAIAEFDYKVRKDKSMRVIDVYSYLFGMCRMMWLNRQRSHLRFTKFKAQLSQHPDYKAQTEQPLENEIVNGKRKALVIHLLKDLPPKGRAVLQMWMQGYSMEEIALEAGLANAKTARNYKHRYLKKLRERVGRSERLQGMLREYRMERA